jgi:hypothetical protein
MTHKRYIPLSDAPDDPRCPWKDRRAIYNAKSSATPTVDSRGRIMNRGDPELLSVFIRLGGRERGPVVIDMERLEQVLERRRLSTGNTHRQVSTVTGKLHGD